VIEVADVIEEVNYCSDNPKPNPNPNANMELSQMKVVTVPNTFSPHHIDERQSANQAVLFTEVLSSGHSTSYGKSFRALLAYITQITSTYEKLSPVENEKKRMTSDYLELPKKERVNDPKEMMDMEDMKEMKDKKGLKEVNDKKDMKEMKDIKVTKDTKDHSSSTGLRLRDLRVLDFHFNPSDDQSIVVRKHAVLFNVDPFRAVVMSDRYP
jgi:hypothetical protein